MRQSKSKLKVKKKLLGWREWVSLPELNIDKIKAKVDTGARTSALHAYNIKSLRSIAKRRIIKFQVHPLQSNHEKISYCHANVIDRRIVKSSIGKKQRRLTISTMLKIGDDEWPIEVTLSNRNSMGFRLLLGRTAIKNKFIVDPGKSFVYGRK